MKKPIILVGTGFMGKEYAKVLKSLKLPIKAFTRSQRSATEFTKDTKFKATTESLTKNSIKDCSEKAIVAVNIDNLGSITRKLISLGVKNILVEKPGGLNKKDIEITNRYIKKYKAKVYVAYNRRWFASTGAAEKIIKTDKGVSSFTFDFTEKQNPWGPIPQPKSIKENWLLANSSHLIDLAFFLGGTPKTISSLATQNLPWKHPGLFVGYGQTKNNSFFSYQANWHAPGRWRIEIMTKKHKLIMCPIEKLQIQKLNSFNIEEFPLTNDLDTKFKPGLYKEVKDFLSSRPKKLPSFSEHCQNLKYYYRILGR